MSIEHTIVVRYEEGSPFYHANMKFEGGDVVAVDFCGNRLRVEEELLEALELAQGFLRNQGYSDDDPLVLGAINSAIEKAKGADHERD